MANMTQIDVMYVLFAAQIIEIYACRSRLRWGQRVKTHPEKNKY